MVLLTTMNLNDKVALVTGGASGIGLACAKEFLASKIKGVALLDVDENNGNKVTEELVKEHGNKIIFIKTNVCDKSDLREAFQKTIETFGNLDIVMNNAGIASEFDASKCYDVNVVGVTHGVQLAMDEFFPKYKSSKSEKIVVNVASTSGLYPRIWYMVPIYSASKCAVLGLTAAYGHEFYYEKTGAKVIAICPGKTTTPLSSTVDPKKIVHVKEFTHAVENIPCQEASELAKNLIIILGQASNGSIWRMEGREIEEVEFGK